MGLVVIVDELGDGGVVATTEHARGGGFGLDWNTCQWLVQDVVGCTYTSSRSMASLLCWDRMTPMVAVST